MISHKGKPLIGAGPEALKRGKKRLMSEASTPFIQYDTTMWDVKKRLAKSVEAISGVSLIQSRYL